MKYTDFIQENYKPKPTDIIAIFSVQKNPRSKLSLREVIGGIAAESSIGTWTEVKTEKPYVKKLAAKVFSIQKKKDAAVIKIAYPIPLFELNNIPNFLSSIAGNIFGLKDIKTLRLEDIDLPKAMIDTFQGPKFGIHGVRKTLKIKKRPLVGTIIKPKLGLQTADHARVAYEAWSGGLDLVKCDENLASQRFNKFEANIRETMGAKNKVETVTGERKAYLPNITAECAEMLKRAKLAEDYGCEFVMVDVLTVGWSAIQTLRKANESLNLIIHAHRAGHAALTRGKHGISMLTIAKLCRLIGVDQLHIGTIVGKMQGPKQEVLDLDQEMEQQIIKPKGLTLAENWHHIKPVFAVCSGGLHALHVPYLIQNLGTDIIIQAGGGIHSLGTQVGAKSMRQAVTATLNNISLKEFAKTHKELAAAIKKFS